MHKNFVNYQNIIINNANYLTLPGKKNPDGNITWVKTEKNFPQRALWWDNKVKLLNVKSRSDVARLIHPKELNGYKPCSVCGKKLSIFYIYPNFNTLKKINKISTYKFSAYEKDIFEIINIITLESKNNIFEIKKIFNIETNANDLNILTKIIKESHVNLNNKGKLGPGVMSNAPDRLDGFHTYNACCRGIKDTGRHKENMSKYTRDRRAYEYWADGDFVLANNLMGQFHKYKEKFICTESTCNNIGKPSPDHVGPISLGFTHRGYFKPMCSSCNSKKNNRMTLSDIKLLLEHEKKGIKVVSWHSKFIWDILKNRVNNDDDAKNLSKIMRINMHYILTIFSYISLIKNGNNFLRNLLNVSYCNNKYTFYNFSPENIYKSRILDDQINLKNILKSDPNAFIIFKSYSDAKTKEKSKDDYIRVSFSSLEDYNKIENRKISNTNIIKIHNKEITSLHLLIVNGSNQDVLFEKLKSVLSLVSSKLASEFK